MLNKYIKLYNKLENYDLFLNINQDESIDWKLFKRNYNLDDADFGPIMTSEKSTYKDLVKFVKKHRKYNVLRIVLKSNVFIGIVTLIISLLNFFLRDDYIRGFVFGIDLMIIATSMIIGRFETKNFEASVLEYEEEFQRKKISK